MATTSSNVPLMPYITMQKTSGILPHCTNICSILEKELTTNEIEELQRKAQLRGKLIRKLTERNLLHSTLTGALESLPVFIFLMKPLTKCEYLKAVAKNNYPTCRTIYMTIMKASVKNDSETATIVESYSIGECTGSELRDQLNKICNCKDVSSESENRPVADVISVGTLDRVPDGSNFVCFQSMPSLDTIQKKNLNCAVFKPSRHVMRQVSILVEDFIIGTAAETAYAGRVGVVPYICFGPRVVVRADDCKVPTATTSSSLFCFAFNSNKRKLTDEIYTVADFFT